MRQLHCADRAMSNDGKDHLRHDHMCVMTCICVKPLPRQTQHQGVELLLRQCHRRRCAARHLARPCEAPGVQSSRRAPHAEAVVHEQLDAGGARVGEQVAVVCLGLAEHLHDAGQQSLRSGAHVHGLGPQATARRCGSPKQLPHPGRALGSRRDRPGDLHGGRAATQLDLDVDGRWRRRCLRHGHRQELRHARGRLGRQGRGTWWRHGGAFALACELAPTVHDVRVHAMRHRHLGYRCPRRRALLQHQRLQLRTVPPAQDDSLRCHRVHLSA